MIDKTLIASMYTNDGMSVAQYSEQSPVLLVFLRHFGCIFCKEALFDISKRRKSLEEKNVKIILVHMASPEVAEDYFKMFGLKGVSHISDQSCTLYNQFGLKKGSSSQLMGLKNWYRGFEVSVGKGIEVSIKQIGDTYQMPGVFVIRKGNIREKYIHKTAADRPDYEALVACCTAAQS